MTIPKIAVLTDEQMREIEHAVSKSFAGEYAAELIEALRQTVARDEAMRNMQAAQVPPTAEQLTRRDDP